MLQGLGFSPRSLESTYFSALQSPLRQFHLSLVFPVFFPSSHQHSNMLNISLIENKPLPPSQPYSPLWLPLATQVSQTPPPSLLPSLHFIRDIFDKYITLM